MTRNAERVKITVKSAEYLPNPSGRPSLQYRLKWPESVRCYNAMLMMELLASYPDAELNVGYHLEVVVPHHWSETKYSRHHSEIMLDVAKIANDLYESDQWCVEAVPGGCRSNNDP